jgi:hypothetical protein
MKPARLWAHAGILLTGGFRKVGVPVSFPIRASNADFADEPIGGGKMQALAARWSLTISFYPDGPTLE